MEYAVSDILECEKTRCVCMQAEAQGKEDVKDERQRVDAPRVTARGVRASGTDGLRGWLAPRCVLFSGTSAAAVLIL